MTSIEARSCDKIKPECDMLCPVLDIDRRAAAMSAQAAKDLEGHLAQAEHCTGAYTEARRRQVVAVCPLFGVEVEIAR